MNFTSKGFAAGLLLALCGAAAPLAAEEAEPAAALEMASLDVGSPAIRALPVVEAVREADAKSSDGLQGAVIALAAAFIGLVAVARRNDGAVEGIPSARRENPEPSAGAAAAEH